MTSCRRFVDRVALVTGAANGIGKATAARLAAEGATVIGTDRAAGADQTHDVSCEEDWERVVADARERFGRLDLVVNNAGFSHVARVTDYSVDDWRALHETDLMGVFLGMKHTIPLLKESTAPAIVNVASTMGLMGFPGIPSYSAAKSSAT